MSNTVNKLITLYGRGEFIVRVILMDMKFEKVTDKVGRVEVNTTSSLEYVVEIERSTRTVKESGRCIITTLLYARLEYQITIQIV